MKEKKPTIAIMYDFDNTLCTKDMQEYSFIPNLGMEPKDFWEECNEFSKSEKMDSILTCMYKMIDKSNANHNSIKREDFVKLGREIEFFPGVEKWFDLINAYGEELKLNVEHYIISSGIKEIIEGTPIAGEFNQIYACEYYYNQNGTAVWPKMSINYTNKTQFLFRINKGVFDVSNNCDLNRVIPENERHTPFTNMIYLGDGMTDIPCMKLVKDRGGKSIAVYKEGQKNKVDSLLIDDRVDFLSQADYREGSELYNIVKSIMMKIASQNTLEEIHKEHMNNIEGGKAEFDC
ncbi:MAG: haloacid dehalogenase-like hydrolase [Clostridia bacterium]|nr:haloacid dehalogenase-like hydrolase [Clostridia bacterium]